MIIYFYHNGEISTAICRQIKFHLKKEIKKWIYQIVQQYKKFRRMFSMLMRALKLKENWKEDQHENNKEGLEPP